MITKSLILTILMMVHGLDGKISAVFKMGVPSSSPSFILDKTSYQEVYFIEIQ